MTGDLRTPGEKRRSANVLGHLRVVMVLALAVAVATVAGCASQRVHKMEVTAYCACGQCTDWERGSWKYLKLDFWNRYVSKGARRGRKYTGHTASGTKPHEPRRGLFTVHTLTHPWMLPFRLVFPWLWFSRDGTVAADTKYLPMGTRLFIPGYGYAVVEDRGGAIKGPTRLDVYFDSHDDALDWGRRQVEVQIED